MARTSTSAPALRRRLLPLAAAGAALALAGCQDDAVATMPDAVQRDLLLSIGVETEVTCQDVDGGTIVAGPGVRFTCTATATDIDGTLVVEGVFASSGLWRSAPVGGSGALGALAGFVEAGEADQGEAP
jgi:hypothetical protein